MLAKYSSKQNKMTKTEILNKVNQVSKSKLTEVKETKKNIARLKTILGEKKSA